MKSIFRKSAIALAILSLTGPSYAGTITGLFAGVDALDLQARNGDLDFVSVFPTTTGGDVYTTAIHNSYNWDFRVYGGLTFCGNDDFTLSWTRFHTRSDKDISTPAGLPPGTVQPSVGPSVVRWLDRGDWSDISSKVTFNLDEVYGVFGHTVYLGPWIARFAGGLEWARLQSNMEDEAIEIRTGGTDDFQPINTVLGNEAQSNMHGFGPRVEGDITYRLPYGLGVFARANAALLIASRKVELEPLDPSFQETLEFARRHVVVPKLGIRLGLCLAHAWGDTGGEGDAESATMFSVEAGWQAESYIHAVERPEGWTNTGVGDNHDAYLGNHETKTSNYGDEGLFVGVKLATSWL